MLMTHPLIQIFFPCVDHESREHEDTLTTEIMEDQLHPAKVPLLPKQDVINSKKIQAMRKDKDRKRAQAKLRSIGPMDYSPLPIDKHEPEFVSIRVERRKDGV